MVNCRCARIGLVTGLLVFSSFAFSPLPATAEWYVAGQAGVNINRQIRPFALTGPRAGGRIRQYLSGASTLHGSPIIFRRAWSCFERSLFCFCQAWF
jgi:hypothetical protein